MEDRRSMDTPSGHYTTLRRSRSCRTFNATSRLGCTPGPFAITKIPSRRDKPRACNIIDKVDTEQLALLVKKEWKLSYVTPLYKFRHTQLKAYSRHLSAFIMSEKQQGVAVEVGLEAGFKVLFTTVLGLAEGREDAETVFIQIQSETGPMFASAGDAPKTVWSGWFTCINGDPDFLRPLPPEFVCLPVFCANGPDSLTSLVKVWFERTFDCSFGSLGLDPCNLQWLATLWTLCHSNTNVGSLKLTWRLPSLPPLHVEMAINAQDAWEVLDRVRRNTTGNDEDDTLSIEEMKCFMTAIERHFYRHFKLYLSSGVLTKVSTALGSLSLDGKIKITCSDYMKNILELLTECALLKMPVFP